MERKKVFILPGEMGVSRQPTEFATLLGSCVAICLYNRVGNFGGMNHYMLPTGDKEEMKGKYGDYSSEKLIEMMLRLDPNKRNLEAKVYGGGAVVGHLSTGEGIGKKNIETAYAILQQHGIPILEREVAGFNGRKIFFYTDNGTVTMRIIEKSEMTQQLESRKKIISSHGIRVLVVDDSSLIRQLITKAITVDPEINVVGEASNAFEAREKILELDPDVVTLDIIMPRMDGITFLKKLMLHYPKPIIVVSSIAQKGSKQRLRAQEIGAVDVVDKEDLSMYKNLSTTSQVLIPKIKSAAMTMVRKRANHEIGHI